MRAGGRSGLLAGGSPPVIRPTRPRPGLPRSPDPGDGEHHQDHEAERDARRGDVQPQPGHMSRLMLGHHPHDRADGHEDDADHDRHGGRHRQDDD